MAAYALPPINTAFIMYVGLIDQSNTKLLKANPTIASGDFKVSIDGGAFANLATLPTVTPAAGTAVKISLSAAEMNGANIVVACIDAAGAEWCDQFLNIQTMPADLFTVLPTAAAGTIGGLLTAPTTANVGLSDLARILGTALTETAGQLAAAFVKFFNKATPTGTINSIPDAVAGATNGISIVGSAMALTSGERTTLNGALLDTVNTGATHNINNSVGKQIRQAGGGGASDALFTGTAVAGATSTTIPLSSGASAVDNAYQYNAVNNLTTGESRIVLSYVGATKIATVDRAWAVNPVNGDTVDITPTANSRVVGYLAGLVPLQPTTAGRTLDVAATGEAGLDFSNVKDGNLDETLVGGTIMAALNAARAQGAGKWALVGTTLTLYRSDNVTAALQFTVDSATAPTSRTPV